MVAISEIVTVLPPKRLGTAELAEREALSELDLEVVERLGVAAVRDAGDRSATRLAAEAAGLLMAGLGDRPAPGAFVLVGGRFPELLMASEATRAQQDAGLTGGPGTARRAAGARQHAAGASAVPPAGDGQR